VTLILLELQISFLLFFGTLHRIYHLKPMNNMEQTKLLKSYSTIRSQ